MEWQECDMMVGGFFDKTGEPIGFCGGAAKRGGRCHCSRDTAYMYTDLSLYYSTTTTSTLNHLNH